MEEKDFENAAKKLMESEEAVKEAKAAADEIIENAAAGAEAADDTAVIADADTANAEAEPALDNTQSLDAEFIEVENAASNGAKDQAADTAAGVSDETLAGDFDKDRTQTGSIDAGSINVEGFDVSNPQYDEHEQNYRYAEPDQPSYAGKSASSDYYSAASKAYEQERSQAAAASAAAGAGAVQAARGFITKRAFIIILIIAMLITMLASVGITTAYTTFLHNKTISSMKVSDDHATNYTLTQSDESLSYKSIIQKTQDSVVSITTESVTNDIWMQNYVTQGAGSGVIIQSDGYIITCEHVIEGARKITVTLRDGTEYDAKLIGADAENDIAVIKIDATGLKAATYGDSSKLEVGDATVIIGNPLGTLSGTVTTGIISALDRDLTIDGRTLNLMQTDASINPGNSGGGMFDASGNLIGIVEAKSVGSDIDGLGFATPINKAAEIAKNLIKNEGKGDNSNYGSETNSNDPKIGIMVTEVDESIAKQYGYAYGGLLVRSVTSTQASLAGLNQGDIIYQADGKDITTQESLTKILSGKKVGDKLKLSIAYELFHEPVSFPRHFPGFGRVHQVFQQQQFVVKMLDGRIQGAAVFSPVGKGPGDPDGPDGVQPVRVLYNHCFQGLWPLPPVFAEGNGVDGRADPVRRLFADLFLRQEFSGVFIMLRGKQLCVIRVMEQRCQRHRLSVASRFRIRDHHGGAVNPHGMVKIVAVAVAFEQRANIFNRSGNQSLLLHRIPFSGLLQVIDVFGQGRAVIEENLVHDREIRLHPQVRT